MVEINRSQPTCSQNESKLDTKTKKGKLDEGIWLKQKGYDGSYIHPNLDIVF